MDRCFWAGNGGGRATMRHCCLNMRRSGGRDERTGGKGTKGRALRGRGLERDARQDEAADVKRIAGRCGGVSCLAVLVFR